MKHSAFPEQAIEDEHERKNKVINPGIPLIARYSPAAVDKIIPAKQLLSKNRIQKNCIVKPGLSSRRFNLISQKNRAEDMHLLTPTQQPVWDTK